MRIKYNKKQFDDLKRVVDSLREPIDKKTADSLGIQVVIQMKRLIRGGISPIKSIGRFPGYKNPDRYPGERKPKRPVNLTLTGKFLDALTFETIKVKSGYAPRIGYDSPKEEAKERGHREGANGQPERPTIPSVSKGEEFAATIGRIISAIFKERIKQILRKKR